MISKRMQDAINEQINKELYSSYLYLSMAAWFGNRNLPGFANWMHVQAKEESAHAMKFFGHLVDRGGKVELKPIAGPQIEWKTALEVFKQVQEHEAAVTVSIMPSTSWPSRRRTILPRCCCSGTSASRWKRRRTPPISSSSWS